MSILPVDERQRDLPTPSASSSYLTSSSTGLPASTRADIDLGGGVGECLSDSHSGEDLYLYSPGNGQSAQWRGCPSRHTKIENWLVWGQLKLMVPSFLTSKRTQIRQYRDKPPGPSSWYWLFRVTGASVPRKSHVACASSVGNTGVGFLRSSANVAIRSIDHEL